MENEKTAAAYIRVSTEEQTELSPESQIKEIRKYARLHGIELLEEHIYIDAGISGRSTVGRLKFNDMIVAAKTKPKPFDVILLWKFSRFARNRQDSIVFKSMLRKECGIDVISVSEPIGDDGISVLMEAIIEAMDEYYSINLSGEVKRGMLEKVQRGGVVSIPPFGYKIEKGKYVIDEEKANIVRSLFNDYLNGVGVRELAVKLNKTGIATSKGGKWENRTVEYILRNPVYIGKIRWNPERRTRRNYDDKDIIITQGKHEPIINEKLFEKVGERLAEVKKRYKKGEHQGERQSDFMLRGIVKCSNCGLSLVQAVKGVSLQCHGYAHGKCAVSHSIVISKINKAVIDRISEDIKIDNFTVSPVIIQELSDDVEKQIKNLNAKLQRAMDAYENGVYELSVFKERKSQIEEQIKELQIKHRREQNNEHRVSNRKDIIKETLDMLTDPTVPETEKNVALRQIVDSIVFNREKNEILIYYL